MKESYRIRPARHTDYHAIAVVDHRVFAHCIHGDSIQIVTAHEPHPPG